MCASIKTVCSKGRPCNRCKRLSLYCSYTESDMSLQDETGESSATVFKVSNKARYTRSSKGCVSCRRRRKKCDEQQPTCGDCQRLELICVPQTMDYSRPMSSSSSSNVHMTADLDNVENSVHFHADEPQNPRTFDSWAVSITDTLRKDLGSSVQESAFSDWIALIGFDDSIGLAKTANLANSTALVDLPVPCATDDEDVRARFLPSTALNNLAGVTPQALKNWTFGERHLLNHFLQSVSRTLVVVEDEDNPFLRIVVPMALENSTVRHSLLALSACHLSKVYPDFERDLLIHRSLALQGLKVELADYGTSEWTLATTLLLCLLEVGNMFNHSYSERNFAN